MSPRQDLEHARVATAALEAVGLAAAVLAADGRILSTNRPFDQIAVRLVVARERISLRDSRAHARWREAVNLIDKAPVDEMRSIPMPADEFGPPLILHLAVLQRGTDLSPRTIAVMVIIPVARPEPPPDLLLQDLFDLSPAEARIAQAIATGRTIGETARSLDMSRETLRTQLKTVFAKTGTRRQATLALLLARASLLDAGWGERQDDSQARHETLPDLDRP
jgi:DNA-binding CsgD family transcriptional regulator